MVILMRELENFQSITSEIHISIFLERLTTDIFFVDLAGRKGDSASVYISIGGFAGGRGDPSF